MPLMMYFWHLCLLRQGPERAPVSPAFLAMLVPLFCAASFLLLSISDQDLGTPVVIEMVFLGLGVQTLCTWLLVAFKRRRGRFRATLVALLGSNTVIMLAFLALALTFGQAGVLSGIVELAYWVCFVWWITVSGFILARALDTSPLQGICVAFTVELLAVIASNWALATGAS
jgi:hypothetical protein